MNATQDCTEALLSGFRRATPWVGNVHYNDKGEVTAQYHYPDGSTAQIHVTINVCGE
jgi:hypothetical protein